MTSAVSEAIRPRLIGGRPPLRLGVAFGHQSPGITERLIGVIDLLAGVQGVHVQNAYRFPERRDSPASLLFRVYEELAARRRGSPGPSTQRAVATCRQLKLGDDNRALSPRDVELISRDNLDILIWLGEAPATGDCSRLARYGVLSLCFGEPERARRQPPYFWEAYRGEAVKTLVVQLHQSTFDQAVFIDRIVARTERRFPFSGNADDVLDAAGHLLIRSLKRLSERDRDVDAPVSPVRSAGPLPSNLETANAFVRHAYNSVSARLKSSGKWLTWQVFIRSGAERFVDQEPFRFEGFRPIEAPVGHYYADPFVVDRAERSFLFFEDFVAAADRGRLAVMEISKDGAHEPRTIRDEAHHFRWNDDYFMVPESAATSTVQLLRCRRFPDQWQLEHVLCDGVQLLDTTPFHLDGVWYFFVYTQQPPQELHLFYAHTLDGRWRSHPANPICSDVRRARSAGALF